MSAIKFSLLNRIFLIGAIALSGSVLAEGMGMGKGGCKNAYMDADGDGVVTRQEFVEGHEKMFDRIDANGDGVIDADERREHHKHKMGKRGQEGCRKNMQKSKAEES